MTPGPDSYILLGAPAMPRISRDYYPAVIVNKMLGASSNSLLFDVLRLKRGAKIYLFKDGFHHSKVMMVDSTFCTVGTANLNSRSLRYDYETNAFIFDPSTTNQLNSMFERDKKNSTLLTPEMWKKRSGWKKFLGWVGNLLTPFL